MVHGALKSRCRYNRIKVKTPSGKEVVHYRLKNRSIAKCAITKKPLRGLKRLTNRKFKNLNRTKKTISRPYGGYMSHSALKIKILEEQVLNQE